MKLFFIAIGSLFLLSACGHHRDVRPNASGEHRVSVRAADTAAGSRDALSQANHFCKERGKVAAIVKEDAKYSGDMDEKTYNNAKRASKVAKGVGSAAWVFGKDKVSDAGAVVGLGGGVADSAIGDGYTVNMTFKCM